MRLAASALACIALAACAPQVIVDGRPLAVVSTPAPAVEPTPPVEPTTTTTALGPLRKAGPILVTPSRVAATVRPLAKALAGWAGSIDGRGRVEIGCSKGVRWREGERTTDIARAADDVVVAPDGSEVVVVRGGKLARHGVVDGRVSRPTEIEGEMPSYAGDHVLAVRRGCTWFAFADDGSPIEIGESCTAPISREDARPRWWVADSVDAAPQGTREGFTITGALALSPDAAPLRVSFGDRRARNVTVSPDGGIVCGIFDERGSDVLDCRPSDTGELERIAVDVFGAPRFAEGGRRMVFTLGDADHVPRALELVDFQHRLVRRIGRIAHHRYEFLAGGDHVVAYDGARGLVFELETGFATPFGDADDAWVALGPGAAPGRFLASRQRGRCIDLVQVELPPPDAAR